MYNRTTVAINKHRIHLELWLACLGKVEFIKGGPDSKQDMYMLNSQSDLPLFNNCYSQLYLFLMKETEFWSGLFVCVYLFIKHFSPAQVM